MSGTMGVQEADFDPEDPLTALLIELYRRRGRRVCEGLDRAEELPTADELVDRGLAWLEGVISSE
jgi:hypothetical protein